MKIQMLTLFYLTFSSINSIELLSTNQSEDQHRQLALGSGLLAGSVAVLTY